MNHLSLVKHREPVPLRVLRTFPLNAEGEEGLAVMVRADDILYVFRGDRVAAGDVIVRWPSELRKALHDDALYVRTSTMLCRLAKRTSIRDLIAWLADRGVHMEEAVGRSIAFNVDVPFLTPDHPLTRRMMVGYQMDRNGDGAREYLLLSRRCARNLRRLLDQ